MFPKSRTVWVNLFFAGLYLATIIAPSLGYNEFKPSEELNQVGTILVILTNLVLRFLTRGPVRF